MAFSFFGFAALVGLALVALSNAWIMIPLGALAILAAWKYTGGDNPYGYRGLGEVYVFLFFGLMATLGTLYTQAGEVTRVGVLGAVGVGAIASAILVANNLRDIPTDRATGKITLAVRLGDRGTRILYAALVAVAALVVVGIALTAPRRCWPCCHWRWPGSRCGSCSPAPRVATWWACWPRRACSRSSTRPCLPRAWPGRRRGLTGRGPSTVLAVLDRPLLVAPGVAGARGLVLGVLGLLVGAPRAAASPRPALQALGDLLAVVVAEALEHDEEMAIEITAESTSSRSCSSRSRSPSSQRAASTPKKISRRRTV